MTGKAFPAKFYIGQIVHHKRYNYRGVVFGFDPECRADEEWYWNNQSQPERDQAWYHVLVDGADHTTYVAQQNLEADSTGEPIRHPLVAQVFGALRDGRYTVERRLN